VFTGASRGISHGIHGDRQVSNTFSGRVIHRIGNGRRYRHSRQLAKTLGAQRARFFIEAADE